jgi:hypothetical protein
MPEVGGESLMGRMESNQAPNPGVPLSLINGNGLMMDLQNSCWNRRVCGMAAARAAGQQMLNWV